MPRLPLEILEQIVELTSPSALFPFSTTESALGDLAEGRLYRDFIFLTNTEKFCEVPWFWGSEKWNDCLRRSITAQHALIKRPHRFQYIRSLRLDGRYHFSRRYHHWYNHQPGASDVDDVIDSSWLKCMVNLRDIECVEVCVSTAFLGVVYIIKRLQGASFTRCVLLNIGSTNPSPNTIRPSEPTAADQVEICNLGSYLQRGLKELHIGHPTHIPPLVAAFPPTGCSEMLTSALVPWKPSELLTKALSDLFSLCSSITSVTITSIYFHGKPTTSFALSTTALSRLKNFSGPHIIAPTFVHGRPVECIDLRWAYYMHNDIQNMEVDILSVLRLSTTAIMELRLHCDLGRTPMIRCIPEHAPSLQVLLVGTVPIIEEFKPTYPEALPNTVLPRLKTLLELPLDPRSAFDGLSRRDFEEPMLRSHLGLEDSLRDKGRCERRDQIVTVCSNACPSLRRIIFGDGCEWGGCDKFDSTRWTLFSWENRMISGRWSNWINCLVERPKPILLNS